MSRSQNPTGFVYLPCEKPVGRLFQAMECSVIQFFRTERYRTSSISSISAEDGGGEKTNEEIVIVMAPTVQGTPRNGAGSRGAERGQ